MLCALLLCGTALPLIACASDGSNSSDITTADVESAETTEAAETAEERLYPDLPETDWNGEEFHVLGRTSDRWQFVSFEIFSEGENGETVNDAVFRRNRDIEEKYNAVVTQDLKTSPQTELFQAGCGR